MSEWPEKKPRQRSRYAPDAVVKRAVARARDAGIIPGRIKLGSDGSVEVGAVDRAFADGSNDEQSYEQWKAGQSGDSWTVDHDAINAAHKTLTHRGRQSAKRPKK